MSTDVNVKGNVTSTSRRNYNDGGAQVEITPQGAQLITPYLPDLTELVRMGDSWHTLSATAAALTAIPTTTSGFSLWNGEPATGKSYAIDSFGCVEVVTDATQQNSLALFAMMNKGTITAPSDDAVVIGSLSGRPYSGLAKKALAASVTNDLWVPHGPSSPGATAFAGAVWRVHEVLARGLYLVPPGRLFNIAAAKSAATASQLRFFIRWHEIQLQWKA